MTHAVPRPRKASTRPGTTRHPVTPGRPTGGIDRRALADRVPLDRKPPLPKRTPGVALDDVHRNSIIQVNRVQRGYGVAPASDRWFRANREPGAQ